MEDKQLKQLFDLLNKASDAAHTAWEYKKAKRRPLIIANLKDLVQQANAILFPDWQLTPRDSKQDLINSMSDVHNGD